MKRIQVMLKKKEAMKVMAKFAPYKFQLAMTKINKMVSDAETNEALSDEFDKTVIEGVGKDIDNG